MNIENRVQYLGEGFYSRENGSLLVSIEGDIAEFQNLKQASSYFKRKALTEISDAEDFFENNQFLFSNYSKQKIMELLKKFKLLEKLFNHGDEEIKAKKEIFVQLLQEMESLKTSIQNEELSQKLVKTRDQLLKTFMQESKLSRIIKTNRDIEKKIKERISVAEDVLLSRDDGSEHSIFAFLEAKKEIGICKQELKKGYMISPHKEGFERIKSVLNRGKNADNILDFDELYQRIKRLKEEIKSFA